MEKARGRRVASAVAAAGILAIAGAAIGLRERLIEAWQIRKLETGSAEEKKAAMRRLAAMGSARGARGIAAIIVRQDDLFQDALGILHGYPKPITADGLAPITDLLERPPGDAFAFEVLEGIGKAAAPALAETVRSGKTWRTRLLAALLLTAKAGEADSSVPALADALRDEDLPVRLAAARGLGRFGGAARSAIAALEEVLRKDSFEVRLPAWRSLEKIRGQKPIPLADLWRLEKGPCEHPLPERKVAAPAAAPAPPAAMADADRDAVLQRLGEKAGAWWAAPLVAARDWVNPHLEPRFEGAIFSRLFAMLPVISHPDITHTHGGADWTAILEEIGGPLDEGEKRAVGEAVRASTMVYGLIESDLNVDFRATVIPAAEDTGEEDEKEEVEKPAADGGDREVAQMGLEAQAGFLFGEFVRDLKGALAPDHYAKLVAFLRSLHLRVDG